jgi:hypothetical protein
MLLAQLPSRPRIKTSYWQEITHNTSLSGQQETATTFVTEVWSCLFVFLALQPIVVVFSQPRSGL